MARTVIHGTHVVSPIRRPQFAFLLLLVIPSLNWAEQGDPATEFPAKMEKWLSKLPSINSEAVSDEWVERTVFLQDASRLGISYTTLPAVQLPTVTRGFSASLRDASQLRASLALSQSQPVSLASFRRSNIGIVTSLDAALRVTTDAGDLLKKSPTLTGVKVQKRSPIVNDPRVRGSRVGKQAASGSHWVPARADLDTMLSKIDSRAIEAMMLIRGPYSVRHGPGFNFVDTQLQRSPRFDPDETSNYMTNVDYKTNGDQWHARQEAWTAGQDWGINVGYGHRTGSDYSTGSGGSVPASYDSRQFNLATGYDASEFDRLELNFLRLDQTDVEFPGQAFDIDFLVTDGVELQWEHLNGCGEDPLHLEIWYNRTRFAGSAQRVGKRRQFPLFNAANFDFVGFTDVDSMSTGYTVEQEWNRGDATISAGTDLRFLKQELNEIVSGNFGGNLVNDANSPIPDSYQVDPGVFIDYVHPVDCFVFSTGLRFDYVENNLNDDPFAFGPIGTDQLAYEDILGTSEFQRSFFLWSTFATLEMQMGEHTWLQIGGGYAEQAPSLTEMYAAQTFLFLLQNGQNVVTGDPRLRKERLLEVDLGLRVEHEKLSSSIRGFYGWMYDYITFEATGVFRNAQNRVEQVNLHYVNTPSATLAGFEFNLDYELNSWVQAFGRASYVEGRDLARHGNFATAPASLGSPKVRVANVPRGAFSGLTTGGNEPLPGISPLNTRIGVLIQPPTNRPTWGCEISLRAVDGQDRIAESLRETTTPGFAVWDVRSYWSPTETFRLVAGVENLSDKAYREHLDFRSQNGIQILQPGASFYAGTQILY